MKILKTLTGFFVGENSHKREIGVAFAILLTFAFQFGMLTADQYEALMGFVIVFMGLAYNARITKLKKAFLDADG